MLKPTESHHFGWLNPIEFDHVITNVHFGYNPNVTFGTPFFEHPDPTPTRT